MVIYPNLDTFPEWARIAAEEAANKSRLLAEIAANKTHMLELAANATRVLTSNPEVLADLVNNTTSVVGTLLSNSSEPLTQVAVNATSVAAKILPTLF